MNRAPSADVLAWRSPCSVYPMAPVCWFAERMYVLTRGSALIVSSVGPSRFASAVVRVFVSVRWVLVSSSGATVSSGRGAAADSRMTQL